MRKFERSKSMKRGFQWNLRGQWHISCESTIFQFKTEADFRLGFPSRKKEFDQGSKESHPFMFFAIFLTSICGAETFQFDISFFRIQFWGRSLVLTRQVKQKTTWVGRTLELDVEAIYRFVTSAPQAFKSPHMIQFAWTSVCKYWFFCNNYILILSL